MNERTNKPTKWGWLIGDIKHSSICRFSSLFFAQTQNWHTQTVFSVGRFCCAFSFSHFRYIHICPSYFFLFCSLSLTLFSRSSVLPRTRTHTQLLSLSVFFLFQYKCVCEFIFHLLSICFAMHDILIMHSTLDEKYLTDSANVCMSVCMQRESECVCTDEYECERGPVKCHTYIYNGYKSTWKKGSRSGDRRARVSTNSHTFTHKHSLRSDISDVFVNFSPTNSPRTHFFFIWFIGAIALHFCQPNSTRWQSCIESPFHSFVCSFVLCLSLTFLF